MGIDRLIGNISYTLLLGVVEIFSDDCSSPASLCTLQVEGDLQGHSDI